MKYYFIAICFQIFFFITFNKLKNYTWQHVHYKDYR